MEGGEEDEVISIMVQKYYMEGGKDTDLEFGYPDLNLGSITY